MKDFGAPLNHFRRAVCRALALAVFVLPAAAAAEADPPGLAGDFRKTVVVAGVTRSWLLHVPASYSAARPTPVVLLLHGGGGRAAGIGRSTGGFSALADRHGFIAVYPDSRRGHWDDGRETVTDPTDDVNFIGALLDALAAEYKVDARRTYAAGISNGGMMAMRLACELSGRFAAVATVGANMPVALAASCRPARAVPVVMFSGTADPLMPYAGGRVAGRVGGAVLSAPETAAFWARINGAAASPQARALADADPGDGTTTELLEYSGDVALYRVNGGGHTWPGGAQYAASRFVGKVSKDFSANEAIHAFFARHTLP
ncbi:MAG: PHB depolymerase family esterase [Burkholderiaceae bacterium]